LQKAIRAEYTILRAPLSLLDARVVSRLDEGSRVRTTFERGLETLDSAAGRLLGPRPAQPQTSPAEPAEPAEPAGEQELPPEEQEEIEELTEVLLAEQEEQTFVGELADDELRRVQAELRAKHQVEEQHGQ
jgi:hypothetical protein